MAAKSKKPTKPAGTVGIRISGMPDEAWFFNRFDIQVDGSHLFLRLAHARGDGVETVFSGAVSVSDISDPALETYVGRLELSHVTAFQPESQRSPGAQRLSTISVAPRRETAQS
jgi:hypothetical protein